MSLRRLLLSGLLSAALSGGCGDDGTGPIVDEDAGAGDAGRPRTDGGGSVVDAGLDAGGGPDAGGGCTDNADCGEGYCHPELADGRFTEPFCHDECIPSEFDGRRICDDVADCCRASRCVDGTCIE